MNRTFLALACAAITLAGCASGGFHDSAKIQAVAIGFSPTTGVQAGYLGATLDRSQNVDKDGKPITVTGCNGRGQDSPDTFANLNSKATASASSVTPVAAAAAAAAGGVQSPSIAWASGDTTANGAAAIVAAASMTAHPADTIAAICDNHDIPSAAATSIVRDGVAPKE